MKCRISNCMLESLGTHSPMHGSNVVDLFAEEVEVDEEGGGGGKPGGGGGSRWDSEIG